METMIRIQAVRPMCVRGFPVVAGATVEVSSADAASAIDSGRARLADPADAARLAAVREAQARRAMGAGWPRAA